jgi:hypothetical protein
MLKPLKFLIGKLFEDQQKFRGGIKNKVVVVVSSEILG